MKSTNSGYTNLFIENERLEREQKRESIEVIYQKALKAFNKISGPSLEKDTCILLMNYLKRTQPTNYYVFSIDRAPYTPFIHIFFNLCSQLIQQLQLSDPMVHLMRPRLFELFLEVITLENRANGRPFGKQRTLDKAKAVITYFKKIYISYKDHLQPLEELSAEENTLLLDFFKEINNWLSLRTAFTTHLLIKPGNPAKLPTHDTIKQSLITYFHQRIDKQELELGVIEEDENVFTHSRNAVCHGIRSILSVNLNDLIISYYGMKALEAITILSKNTKESLELAKSFSRYIENIVKRLIQITVIPEKPSWTSNLFKCRLFKVDERIFSITPQEELTKATNDFFEQYRTLGNGFVS